MRLRITVRRHGLPDTPIVWVVDTATSPIVYQLLEKVNEIIPIESEGEWGLEDYAVELKSFSGVNYECLHFQPVGSVMKEDDEVLIRPLLTQDVKIRRISGRRQISSAGAHMLDGVMYGRPFLRLMDRPPIHIPPRKRRRIEDEYDESVQDEQAMIEDQKMDEEAEEAEEGENQQLVLHADFNEDDSEEDDDFAPPDSEDDDASIDDEEASVQGSEIESEVNDQDIELDESNQEEEEEDIEGILAGIKAPTKRAKIRKLHAAFPSSKPGVGMEVLKKVKYDLGEAFDAMATGFSAVQSRRRVVIETLQDTSELKVRKTRSKPPVAKTEPPKIEDSIKLNPDEMDVDEEEALTKEESKEDVEDGSDEEGSDDDPMVNYYDHNGLPPGSIASGRALDFMADALNGTSSGNGSGSGVSRKIKFADEDEPSIALESTPAIDKVSKADSSSKDSEDSSEEDHSSDDDSSEVSSDSSDEDMDDSSSSDSSSSDSDSSSDSSSDDDEPEEQSSKVITPSVEPVVDSASTSEIAKAKSKSTQHVAPPGNGSKGTRSRNERRRKAEALARYKEKGVLPVDTTIEEFKSLDPNRLSSKEEATTALLALRTEKASGALQSLSGITQNLLADSDKFEQRRKELLASLAAGGVDVDKEPVSIAAKKKSRKQEEKTRSAVEETVTATASNSGADPSTNTLTSGTIAAEAESEAMNIDEIDLSEPADSNKAEVVKVNTPTSASSSSAGPGPRRAKLDLGAGRRMLFGALGIKNPKTKKDEEKVQADLMKYVRQPLAPKIVEPEPGPEIAIDEDPDAWRANIILRAVECVQENVELSEPPFPFKQRWDPQQWNDRNGKRKKDQRDSSQFYDETRPSKKQKRRKGKNNRQDEYDYAEAPELNYDDNDAQYDEAMNVAEPETQNAEEDANLDAQAQPQLVSQSPEDLAALPEDMSTLSDLTQGAAKVGMTIAFKCLEMSEATKWQPKMSPYKTAIVISISDDNELQLSLAMRDREPGKAYNEETGERIYGKFEMPDDDEDMDGEDEGVVYHQFYDFVEPKIVQEPPASLSADTEMEEGSKTDGQAKGDTSATLSNEEVSPESQPEAQLSHISETQISQTVEDVEPVQEDEVEENGGGQQAPGIIVSADLSQAFDTPLANPVLTMDPVTPFTPGLRARDTLYADAMTPSAQISKENRRNIAHLMKNAGFRSSVPSSIVRGIQPDTPGDMAAFQKLMDEMADTSQETPAYSPKFNGFESSPPHTRNEMQSNEAKIASIAAAQPSSSQMPQSSWETVDPQLENPAEGVPMEVSGEASHIAEDAAANKSEGSSDSSSDSSSDDSASPSPEQVKPKKKLVPKQVPISKAQQLWEQFQSKKKGTSNRSSPELEQEGVSQATSTGLDGFADNQSSLSVHYPKLSEGSSVTSQIADHGRQPDFAFEDSEMLNMETPTLTTSSKDSASLSRQNPASGTLTRGVGISDKAKHTSDFEDALSDQDVEFPVQNLSRGRTTERMISEEPQAEASSDDSPSLAALSQHSQLVKKERSRSIDPKISRESIKKTSGSHYMNPPPASQPRAFQFRDSPPSASQSRPSQSQPVFKSQVVDLTMTSSDAEPEDAEPSLELEARTSNMTNMIFPDDEDDEFGDGGGWIAKSSKTSNGSGKRQPSGSGGFRESSETSLNAKRKGAHRYR